MCNGAFFAVFFFPLLWLQALTMWKKKLPGLFPEKNLFSAQSASEEDFKQHWEDWLCFRPNSLVPIGFFLKVPTALQRSPVPSLHMHFMHVFTHLTGKRSCCQDCLFFQGPAPHLPETSAKATLMWFPWNLHLLDRSPWQQLIPGSLFSTAAFPKRNQINPSFSA